VRKPTFAADGAQHFAGVLAAHSLTRLRRLADATLAGRPGARIAGEALCALLVEAGAVGRIARQCLGKPAEPVRAIVFDKSAATNWAIGWHQDRTIVVRERIDAPGFGPWSRKNGLQHVEPPVELLARMATLRVHLDDCGPDNAPLRVALGSYRRGRAPADRADLDAAASEQVACIAEAGDVWSYATLILHASDRAVRPSRRRVLQVDYATDDLPAGLQWLGL
jgi:hypothetical protein